MLEGVKKYLSYFPNIWTGMIPRPITESVAEKTGANGTGTMQSVNSGVKWGMTIGITILVIIGGVQAIKYVKKAIK